MGWAGTAVGLAGMVGITGCSLGSAGSPGGLDSPGSAGSPGGLDSPGDAGSPGDGATTDVAGTGSGEPTATTTNTTSSSQPLVLATNVTQPRLRLTLPQARRLITDRSDRWHVVAAPGVGTVANRAASSGAALRTVRRDPTAVAVVPAEAVGPAVRVALVDGQDPLRQPTRYPLRTQGPRPPRPTTLAMVGDIMLGRGVPDPAIALRPMSARLGSADLTVGNLESTLSTHGTPQQGDDSFSADRSAVPLLARAGLDALSLANNHTGDFERRALLETVRTLRDSPIRPFGAGSDLAEASRPVILRRHGVSFGFLGFNAIGETPRAARHSAGALSVGMPPRTGPLDQADLDHVTRLVRRLDRRVDVVVVLPHWGAQYTHRPRPVQRLVAARLVVAGADLVVGGHPHWVQGLDLLDGRVVAHSLGNFVFDMDFMTETLQGVVLEATYWRDRLKAVELVPYRMDGRFAPRPAVPAEARAILGDVWSTSTGPFRVR